MSPSTGARRFAAQLDAPRPGVLASMTDAHFLAALGGADEPLSRAQIADRTGLSRPAISGAAVRLLERGIIAEAGVLEGRRGGVATLLRLNAEHGHSIAVAVQTDAVAVRTRDLAGHPIGEWRRGLPRNSSTDDLLGAANALIAQADPGTPLLAATVSLAHAVDSRTGQPVQLARSASPTVVFDTADLRLEDAASVQVDNDVNWATLAEVQEGSLTGARDFVYVYCGSGLGAGLFLDGRLFRGRMGLAGEIGYLREGPNRDRDLTERLAALGLGSAERYGLDLDVASAVFGADPLGGQAAEIAETVAVSVANLVTTLNPEAVALGGPLASYPAFFEHVAGRVGALTIDPPRVVRSDSTPLDGASLCAHTLALEVSGVPGGDEAAR